MQSSAPGDSVEECIAQCAASVDDDSVICEPKSLEDVPSEDFYVINEFSGEYLGESERQYANDDARCLLLTDWNDQPDKTCKFHWRLARQGDGTGEVYKLINAKTGNALADTDDIINQVGDCAVIGTAQISDPKSKWILRGCGHGPVDICNEATGRFLGGSIKSFNSRGDRKVLSSPQIKGCPSVSKWRWVLVAVSGKAPLQLSEVD